MTSGLTEHARAVCHCGLVQTVAVLRSALELEVFLLNTPLTLLVRRAVTGFFHRDVLVAAHVHWMMQVEVVVRC